MFRPGQQVRIRDGIYRGTVRRVFDDFSAVAAVTGAMKGLMSKSDNEVWYQIEWAPSLSGYNYTPFIAESWLEAAECPKEP